MPIHNPGREAQLTGGDTAWANPLLRQVHGRQRAALLLRFPSLQACGHGLFLSVRQYIDQSPECYYSEAHFSSYSRWLAQRHATDPQGLANYLDHNQAHLNRAFVFLSDINRLGWHESLLPEGDDYFRLRFVDEAVHPAYLRLVDGVFGPLLHPAAFFSRTDRGRGTEGLDLFNILQELGRTDLSGLLSSCNRTVRNALAHGGFTYHLREIEYRDRTEREALADTAIISLFDDLLDACNGMALALRIFLLSHSRCGYSPPLQVLIDELKANVESPWWRVEACIVSQVPQGRQLVIYARPHTRDYSKVAYSTLASAGLAAQLMPGFGRYFFSLRGPHGWPGWASFRGKDLAVSRAAGMVGPSYCVRALEDPGVFFVCGFRLPRFLGAVETFLHSMRIHVPPAVADARQRRGVPDVLVRHTSLHRQGLRSVLRGHVVIPSAASPVDRSLVRSLCSRITRTTLSVARREVAVTAGVRYLPLGYARIAVFRRNHRPRRLTSFGLGTDLICTIQLKHIRRIQAPDLYGSTTEDRGHYRVAWNRAWLRDSGERDS